MLKVKTIILSLIFISIISVLSVSALSYSTYYECPSLMNYSPNLRNDYVQGCREFVKAGIKVPAGFTCESSYNEQYGNTDKEYKNGKCKVSNEKYIKGTYTNTSCTLTFQLTPEQKITGYSYGGGNEISGAKCVDNLYKSLKAAYPNIKRDNN